MSEADIYLIGGKPETNKVQHLSLSATGNVTILQNGPPVPVEYVARSAAVVHNHSQITLTGGKSRINGADNHSLVWHLNVKSNPPQWTRRPDLLTGRRSHVSFSLGKYLFVATGYNGVYVTSVERLDISVASPIWQQITPNYPLTVVRAACVVVRDDAGVEKVWISGGWYKGYTFNAVYTWRGPGYSWQAEANMTQALS